jgi:hypothetical protein
MTRDLSMSRRNIKTLNIATRRLERATAVMASRGGKNLKKHAVACLLKEEKRQAKNRKGEMAPCLWVQ